MHREAEQPDGLVIRHRKAIVLASDHAGYPLKDFVQGVLAPHCDGIIRLGAESEAPVDFPDVTREAVAHVRAGRAERAVLVCGTGAGACIAANKISGIRAAVCNDTFVARQCVIHDDVNVLCLGAWIIGPQIAAAVVRAFLSAEFSQQEQFRRRVEKLDALDRERQR